jgi:hypothetical protein
MAAASGSRRASPTASTFMTLRGTLFANSRSTQPFSTRNEQNETTSSTGVHLHRLARPTAPFYETIISPIGNTTNRGGLVVRARLDRHRHPVGKKVFRQELRELLIERYEFHGIGTTSSSRARSYADRLTLAFRAPLESAKQNRLAMSNYIDSFFGGARTEVRSRSRTARAARSAVPSKPLPSFDDSEVVRDDERASSDILRRQKSRV